MPATVTGGYNYLNARPEAIWPVNSPDSGVAIEGTSAVFTLTLTGTMSAYQTATVQVRLNDIGTNASDRGDLARAIAEAVNTYPGPGSVSFDGTTLSYTSDEYGQPMAPIQVQLPITDGGVSVSGETMSIELENPGNSDVDYPADEAPIEIQDAAVKMSFLARFMNWLASPSQYV